MNTITTTTTETTKINKEIKKFSSEELKELYYNLLKQSNTKETIELFKTSCIENTYDPETEISNIAQKIFHIIQTTEKHKQFKDILALVDNIKYNKINIYSLKEYVDNILLCDDNNINSLDDLEIKANYNFYLKVYFTIFNNLIY